MEAFIGIVAGLFLLFLAPRFMQWMLHSLFGTSFVPFVKPDGTVVPYPQVPAFWMDLGPFAFSVVLILDGIVLLAVRRRSVLMAMLGLTTAAALYNLIYLVVSFPTYGFAPLSFLAAAFGAMMAFYQWRLIQALPRQ